MAATSLDDDKLKELMKAAVIEVLEERRDLVRDVLEEALEEIALARAIEEGEQSAVVSREEVMEILEGGRRTSSSGRASPGIYAR